MNKFNLYFFQFFAVIFTCFCGHTSLKAATFHSILIGDTDDKELKKVVRKDLLHMEKHIQEVFSALDAVDHLAQNIYVGKRANASIMDELKNLKVETDDIIFLYFSGHGFNTKKNQIENWPFLYFNHGDVGINSYDVVEALIQHQPRLIICFVDCCNNILKPKEFPNFFGSVATQNKVAQKMNPLNIRQLFQATTGVILISSASPGYYSEGTDEDGSDFTNAYIKFFKRLMAAPQTSTWEDLLSKTQHKLWKRQRPFYELIIQSD